MEGSIFIIFENLDIAALSYEEGMDCLYYVDFLLEKEESPESFIKYQFIKNKIEGRLKELKKKYRYNSSSLTLDHLPVN